MTQSRDFGDALPPDLRVKLLARVHVAARRQRLAGVCGLERPRLDDVVGTITIGRDFSDATSYPQTAVLSLGL